MKPGRRAAALMVVLGVLLPLVAHADYKESYKEGVTAVDRKQWADVARHMQDAIRQNPQAGGPDVRIYGTRMEDYLPYYYLGMALNELDRYAEAKAALDKALQQGAVGNAPKKISRHFLQLISEVGGKVASMPETTRDAAQSPRTQPSPRSEPPRQAMPTGPTPAEQLATAKTAAESELATASDARARVTGMIQQADRLGVFAADPGLRARWDQANEQLGAARRQLDSAASASVADGVRSTAVRLAGEFIQIQSALDEQIQSAGRANSAAAQRASDEQSRQIQYRLNSLQNDVSEAERLLARATEAGQSAIDVPRQRLARSIAAAKEADANSTTGVLDTLQSALRNSAADLRTAMTNAPTPPPAEPGPGGGAADVESPSTGPPPSLRQAAASFFRGDDDGTLSLLERSSFDDPRAVLQAGLLKAAALYRQFLVGGQSDDVLLQAARGEVTRCKGVDPSFEPDARYFSPTFVALYRDTTGP